MTLHHPLHQPWWVLFPQPPCPVIFPILPFWSKAWKKPAGGPLLFSTRLQITMQHGVNTSFTFCDFLLDLTSTLTVHFLLLTLISNLLLTATGKSMTQLFRHFFLWSAPLPNIPLLKIACLHVIFGQLCKNTTFIRDWCPRSPLFKKHYLFVILCLPPSLKPLWFYMISTDTFGIWVLHIC